MLQNIAFWAVFGDIDMTLTIAVISSYLFDIFVQKSASFTFLLWLNIFNI